MLLSSHLLATLLVSRVLSLEAPEVYVALISGVGVDADHFFVNKKWISDIKEFLVKRKIMRGIKQHSWFQEILFGAAAGVLIGFLISYFLPQIRWWIFPAFLVLHIAMDYVMSCEHQPFVPLSKYKYLGWMKSGSKWEFWLSLAGLTIFVFIFLV